MPTQSQYDPACAPFPTSVSARFRRRVRLKFRAHLRHWRSTRTGQTTSKWFCASKQRIRDGSFGQTPPPRTIETWQLRRCVTMSPFSTRYTQLVRMCRRRGCSREDASDLVQEAHLRLLNYERSTKVRNPDSLLRRIVLNLSISHFHRKMDATGTFDTVARLDKQGMLVDPAPGPERAAAAELELKKVVRALTAVSPRTCQVFIAQRAGYSYGEIATAFDIKPPTVDKHVATATLTLRHAWPAG